MTMVETRAITGGADTHLDVHVAAALDPNGGVLGVESSTTDTTGFRELSAWLLEFGPVGGWAWRARAPTASTWPASCAPPASR